MWYICGVPAPEGFGPDGRASSFVSRATDPEGTTYLIQASVMGDGASLIFLSDRDGQRLRGRFWDPVNRTLNRLSRPGPKSGGVLLFVLRDDDDSDPVLSSVMPNMAEARREVESIAAEITSGHFDPTSHA